MNNFKNIRYYISEESGKLKLIPEAKTIVNKNTPVGEPADYYEIKPYNGKKPIHIVGILQVKDGKISIEQYV